MKKIIFRNPFITKKSRQRAKKYLELADLKHEQMRDCNKLEGAISYAYSMVDSLNKAAHCLGFINAKDMDTYLQLHRTNNKD